jgi:hypothetical protein
MGIKHVVESLDNVDDALKSFYTKNEADNKFYLAVDGVVGKEKLDEFRSNNISLQKQLEQFKGIDPAKYKEFATLEQKLKEKQLIDAGKIDEVVEQRVTQMRTELNGQLKEKDTALTMANRKLEVLIIDNAVREAATKVGVLPSAVDDALLRAKGIFAVEDGSAVPKDRDGKIIYGKDANQPMSINEWMGGLKETAPHLFQSSSGGGASGGSSRAAGQSANLTPIQKIEAGLTRN